MHIVKPQIYNESGRFLTKGAVFIKTVLLGNAVSFEIFQKAYKSDVCVRVFPFRWKMYKCKCLPDIERARPGWSAEIELIGNVFP